MIRAAMVGAEGDRVLILIEDGLVIYNQTRERTIPSLETGLERFHPTLI